ncbi:MAG: sigma-54-dependent transcriptional regulator [Candidatus Latescibacterota bacterium]
MKVSILIVDDEKVQREMLGGYLQKKGHTVHLAASGGDALEIVRANTVDIVITDQKMPGMTGVELAAKLHEEHPNLSTVVITAFGTIGDAVRAMRDGVEDYLTKPVDLEELDVIIEKILDKRQLVRENEWLKEQVRKTVKVPGIVYVSETMKDVMSRVARAAESRATVLITGESGTGKEIVARAIHTAGDRREKPFVAVNCSAVPETLIESELFGHEKGSFTGADRRRIGRFEQADGGTLFLDEIGEIPLHVQVKLLRVLQERSFERVGGNEPIAVNVRIIAATNRELGEEIRSGRFRQDLYYRLNVVSIDIPPLRIRRQDITVLAEHFIRMYSEEHGKPVTAITPEALDALIKYPFPGNVRELGNIIEQAVVLSRGDTISARDLPQSVAGHTGAPICEGALGTNLEDQVSALERASLELAMKEANGNKSAAARLLGVSERKVRYMVKKYWGVDD